MADAVKVAVRVRPYNSREKQEGAELCVEMQGNMTKIWNKETHYEKEFFFDYSYWSHDGFREEPNGVLVKDSYSSPYADQMAVYNDLGIGVLNNAFEGYHTCLFAYGQTGSGKSYSIMGYPPNKGIVPMVCEEIFERINSANDPLIQHDVKVSMLEIYNEQVQDLLQDPSRRVKGGLKIRENPKTGVFVDGLVKLGVASFKEIETALDNGNKHRTVAATQMNATSSRAHTVLTISFTQIFHEQGTGRPLNRKQSDINLVDLAGSERASKTGATGDRLQEGSNINRSLSTLGKVITALAKKSAGTAGRGAVVPYRESKLTRILQNALGGNSKTTMIAAISPATFNFEETLSTLRYADQVKAIKNQAIVNETPQEKLIRELREENEKLKAMLEGKGPLPDGSKGGMDDEMRREFEAQIQELQRAKEEAEKTMQQRLDEGQSLARSNTLIRLVQDVQGPQLANLNEDPQLSGKIRHAIHEGTSTVGRDADIRVIGLGIEGHHGTFTRQGNQITLAPNGNTKIVVNGQTITGPTPINHQDRIRFGSSQYFTFLNSEISNQPEVDYEAAVQEANSNEMKSLLGEKEEEMRRKEEEMQAKIQAEWEAAQKAIEEERQRLNAMLNQRQQEDSRLSEREQELLKRQQEMEEELRQKEREMRDKEKARQQRSRLDQVVTNSLQVSNEANERASMLGKQIRFRPEFQREPAADGTIGQGQDNIKMRFRILYPGLNNIALYWPTDTLEGRIPDMAEMCQQYFDGTPLDQIDVGYDPFAIDPDQIPQMMDQGGHIGSVTLISETLYYFLDIQEEPHPIYDSKGTQIGSLIGSIVPDVPGVDIEEEGYDNMLEIEGREMMLEYNIKSIQNLPQEFTDNVYCSYNVPPVGREVFVTNKASGQNLQLNYRNQHTFIVTKFNAKDLEKGQLIINVFGSKPQHLLAEEVNQVRKVLGSAPIAVPPPNKQAPHSPQPPLSPQAPPSNPSAQNQSKPSPKAPPTQGSSSKPPAAPAPKSPAAGSAGSSAHFESQPSFYSKNLAAVPPVESNHSSPSNIPHQASPGSSTPHKPEERKENRPEEEKKEETENERLKRELEEAKKKIQEAENTKKSGCCSVIQ